MGCGMALSVVVFLAALLTLRRRPWTPRRSAWIAVAVSATSAGILLGVAADKLLYESYGLGGWLLGGTLLAAGLAAPLLSAHALMSGRTLPTFLDLFGPRDGRSRSFPTYLLGAAFVVTVLIAVETALGFVFDPRYRDFPFASLTMAVLPFATLLLNRPQVGVRPIAEAVFGGLLAMAALYTVVNEGRDNWQSLWTCAVYLLLAITLWQARAAQIPK
jgi:glucan 1,3-beta-glucosidase